MNTDHRYILIMAGGAGTRLWPLSRQARPKHFQPITGEQTLFQQMVEHAKAVVPAERIYVMSVSRYHPLIQEQAPELKPESIFSEPALRDNGPASALGLLRLQALDAEAKVAILWSDHLIKKPEVFTTTLLAAFEAAEANPKSLVTVGAKPTFPNTGFGYIQMGNEIGSFQETPVFAVKQFTEKPDLATAEQYVSSWEYLWNVGYKIITVRPFFDSIAELRPDLQPQINALSQALAAKDEAALEATYNALPKQSIEYMFTSYLKDILVVPADMGWSDVGTWDTLYDELAASHGALVTQGKVNQVNSRNSLVYAKDRPISLVGVDNLIVVDAGDTILVMNKDAAQDIKTLVKQLEENNQELL